MTRRPIIINATSIGVRKDGITAYGLHLLRTLWTLPEGRTTTVVLSESARDCFAPGDVPDGASVEWVTPAVSAARGTRGNLRRWLMANGLALRRREALIFGLSQLEAPLVGPPGVVMVHDMIPWLFPAAHPRQHHFYRHVLGPALKRAVAVVTPSAATRDHVCRGYGLPLERVHVIPHGSPVPIAFERPPRRGNGRYVLWIGRPDPTKNLSTLIAAFRLVQRQLDVRLVIAGEGSEIEENAAGLRYDASDRITVLGPVSESEKIALLDGASALVCPSLHEGFGFTPLEAMARGCPVVAAGAGALPEVCGDAAIYADPRRPDAIADALRRVLLRPELAQALAARGRTRSAAWSWEASVRAHLTLLNRCAIGPPDPSRAPTPSGGQRMSSDAVPETW